MRITYKRFTKDYQSNSGDIPFYFYRADYFLLEFNNFLIKGYPRHVAIILVIGKSMGMTTKIMYEVVNKPVGINDISGVYAFFETFGEHIEHHLKSKKEFLDLEGD